MAMMVIDHDHNRPPAAPTWVSRCSASTRPPPPRGKGRVPRPNELRPTGDARRRRTTRDNEGRRLMDDDDDDDDDDDGDDDDDEDDEHM